MINAAWAAFALTHVVGPERASDIDVVFSVYDLDSRYLRLTLAESAPFAPEEMGLFPAPKEIEQFRDLGRAVCGGGYVGRLLGRRP